jgi:hypothetical protein
VVGERGDMEFECLSVQGDALVLHGERGDDMGAFFIGEDGISVGVGAIPGGVGKNGITEKLEGDVLCLGNSGLRGRSGIGGHGHP